MAGTEPSVGLVLVHGGGHQARCWTPTIEAIADRSDVPVLAVDLPGRGTRPGPLRGLRIADFVDAVQEQIEHAGIERMVLVGHSMAGMVVPGVAASLGPSRVVRTVLIAANVAPAGGTVLDTLPWPTRVAGTLATRWPRPYRMPKPLARAMFCNGMAPAEAAFVLDQLGPEAGWLAREPIDDAPAAPVTWVLTERDRAVGPELQRATIAALGDRVDRVVELEAPHDAMVSHPQRLAAVLIEAATTS